MKDKVLQRYIEGYSSQQEKEAVAKWILDSEDNKQHYLLLRRLYDAILMSDLADAKPQRPTIKLVSRRFVYEIVKIAAVFLLSFGIYQFLLPDKFLVKESPITMQTLRAPEGQRAEITLADGTRIWLNANTTLTFPTHFAGSERRVELDGEAYFDVTHNEQMKFIVQTEHYQVDVLGTEFNVKAYRQNHRFETALIRGSVEIAAPNGETLRLVPNQRARAENGHLAVATLPHHDSFLWKEGIIVFEHQTIREIFDELQLYYDVNIKLKNDKLPNAPFTGKFRTKDGVEHVLKVLQLRHKFDYKKDDESNSIIIY